MLAREISEQLRRNYGSRVFATVGCVTIKKKFFGLHLKNSLHIAIVLGILIPVGRR